MKRPRGRPGKPAEYWDDLHNLPLLRGLRKKLVLNCGGEQKEFVVGRNLLDACRKFFAKYASVQWRDRRSNELLFEISDASTLRTRIIEAQRRKRKEQELLRSVLITSTKIGSATGGRVADGPPTVLMAWSDIKTTMSALGKPRDVKLVIVERILHRK
jgi:hypothetical protein